jgi:hypothetical protein
MLCIRITLLDHDVPNYFRSLEHLLRYCARPRFEIERLSVIRNADGRISRIGYVLPQALDYELLRWQWQIVTGFPVRSTSAMSRDRWALAS